jgi:hypothetical protein
MLWVRLTVEISVVVTCIGFFNDRNVWPHFCAVLWFWEQISIIFPNNSRKDAADTPPVIELNFYVIFILVLTFKTLFNVYGSVHRKYIPMYIQQDATLHSSLYLETALHVSGGASTHHQERIHLYLQHLVFVTPLLLPAAIAAGSSNGVTITRCCRYSCMRSWWWVEAPPETCRAVSRYNELCNVASCWIYIGILQNTLTSYRSRYKVGWLWAPEKQKRAWGGILVVGVFPPPNKINCQY